MNDQKQISDRKNVNQSDHQSCSFDRENGNQSKNCGMMPLQRAMLTFYQE